MKYLSKITKHYSVFLLATVLLTGCATEENESPNPQSVMKYQVVPEQFSLGLEVAGNTLTVANPMKERTVADFKEEEGTTSWTYPSEQISVRIEPTQDFLSVSITADSMQDSEFAWPQITAEEYYLPLGEGKKVPANDETWMEYLSGSEYSVLEQFSMPFWASSMGDYAVMYIMEDSHRSQVKFEEKEKISFHISYQYPEISKNRTKRFRIYVTENNPVAVAKVYRKYVMEQGNFLTLEQKEEAVPTIKKLYGAPFIYLWGNFVISPSDIQWNAFRQILDDPIIHYFLTFAETQENGMEFKNTLEEMKKQNYVADYQKNVICSYMSSVLTEENFWNRDIFTDSNSTMNSLLEKGIENLNNSEKIQLNKQAIWENLPGVFEEPSTWMNGNTVEVLRDLKESGIETAWVGLHGWEQAFAKPELVDVASEQGYLIASYDSYHSIHEPGKEQWETARFQDTTLYEQATVTNQEGNKIEGFQKVGRKLNPVLAFPSVKERMKNIIDVNNLSFNSWFVDCDATGEIYDDYTKTHVTTQEEDLASRMERMAYIRDTYQMVVGSEGGNDFAASTIAFAHGIELKSFSWMDADMNKNKESEYYIGKYFSPTGGVAEHFAKRVPLKEKYNTLFVDPRYDIPLFKLVYNDSIVTSYHWEWSTFKIKNATQKRMLREVLYNVPPLYHLDGEEWAEYKEDIVKHTAVWSNFSKQATNQEMTDFKCLSSDGLVQITQYGTNIYVIANFGNSPYSYQEEMIPAESALIYLNGKTTIYTPELAPEHK